MKNPTKSSQHLTTVILATGIPPHFLKTTSRLLLVFGLIFGQNSHAFAQDLWQLYQASKQHNDILASQQYDHFANKINEDLAKGDLLPQIGLQGSIKHNQFYPKNNNIPNSNATTSQFGLGLHQALFRADKWATLEKAKIASGINDLQLLKQQQELTEQVIRAYLGVLQTQALTESLNAEYDAIKAQNDMMQARLQQGIVARVDTEETEARLQNVRALLANNDVAILNAKQQLALLTGVAIDDIDPLILPINTDLVAEKSLDNYLIATQQQNFDLLLAQQQVALAKKNQDLLKSHLYPKVDLVANIAWQDTNHQSLRNNNGINYGIGIEMELPFYTGGRTTKGLQQGAYQTESAISKLKFVYQNTLTQTSKAYLNLMGHKTTIIAQQIAVDSNAKVNKATQTGYDVGVRSMVDTLLAQRQYYATRRQLINASFDYLNAYVDLQKATGNLNDNTVKTLNNLLTKPK
ncbi:channel-tunnel spanning the outer membrane and periplasm segregation of daughter chromosomes [Moraxella macacae 0408225]|uniref:Channel-tunnel spanning the outer membrane and periplasm segregation of daughter chromosomes n=1 Tax=Moraxella macacae 0408225 TaxID=1230338 RepID=L2F8J4_9GAMM|nr:TolC family protein [Moraxella macacae]ELA09056.1 channel-tunnel spanning the outer membrane and periplasm segregation of daughter chromosomes [Moraxella macacae 0408225]